MLGGVYRAILRRDICGWYFDMGRTKLRKSLRKLLDKKLDKPKLIPATLGAMINGIETVKVANRVGFVYARIRGSDSEIVQAFNEQTNYIYGLPVLLRKDRDRYYVEGRDISRYDEWTSGYANLAPHGRQHSLYGGDDIVWVHKKQITPFGVYPYSGTSVRVNEDWFLLDDSYVYFTGTIIDLQGLRPGSSNTGRFASIYYNTTNRNISAITGSTFSTIPMPDNIDGYIPKIGYSIGIPLASVFLYGGQQNVTLSDIYDLRPIIQGYSPEYIYNRPTLRIYDSGVFKVTGSAINFGTSLTVSVTGTTAHVNVTNVDADTLDGQHGSYYTNADNLSSGTVSLARIPSTLTGKDADTLDGQHGSFYQNASNINSGTLSTDRFSAYSDLVAESKVGASTGQVADARWVKQAFLGIYDITEDFTTTTPSGWSWKTGTGFVTPGIIQLRNDSVIRAIINSTSTDKSYFYRNWDTGRSNVSALIWMFGSTNIYSGIRVENDTNFIEVYIRLDSTSPRFKFCGNINGTEYILSDYNTTVIPPYVVIAFNRSGSSWSSWLPQIVISGLVTVITSFGVTQTWQPTRVGWVTKWVGVDWNESYIDWMRY